MVHLLARREGNPPAHYQHQQGVLISARVVVKLCEHVSTKVHTNGPHNFMPAMLTTHSHRCRQTKEAIFAYEY
jgi:hypothetical protein